MDEETIRQEFEEWAASYGYSLEESQYDKGEYKSGGTHDAWNTWLEATHRADSKIKELGEKLQGAEHAIKDILIELYNSDRKAREECAEICGRVWVQQAEGIAAARSCQEAIRATIKDE